VARDSDLRRSAIILDSLATLKLVAFLEERFGITLEAHEADVEHLNTICDITELVLSKK
jgi:acyl carrier protein